MGSNMRPRYIQFRDMHNCDISGVHCIGFVMGHWVNKGYVTPFTFFTVKIYHPCKVQYSFSYFRHWNLFNYLNLKMVLEDLQTLALGSVFHNFHWFKCINTDIHWHSNTIYVILYKRCSLNTIQNSSSSVINCFIIDKPLMATHVTLIVVLHVKAHQESVVENTT